MCTRSFVRADRLFAALVGAMALVLFGPTLSGQGPGGPAGVDIQIRAENRSTADRPFCGVGGGMIGDTLRVDAFMDMNGVVTGTAFFERPNGSITVIPLDRMFIFELGSSVGGLLVQNQASQNTVPIWMSDTHQLFGFSPALVNVELPRGCVNTKSTFTPGVDKVTMQIRFR